jgi:hypothetical protein
MATNSTRSTTKRSTTKATPRKTSGAKKASGARTTKAATNRSRATRSASSASSNGAKRSSSSRSSANRSSRPAASRNGSGGVVDIVKNAAGKAVGPAVTVGAAAVGIAGGIALKNRARRKTVLGVRLPRSIGKGLPDIDAKSIAKSVGQASKQFAKTTKNVSKDLERAGDQAERIGKILD